MNPDTRVSIHAWAGDIQRVHDTLDVHLAHECPITLMSPADSHAIIEHPRVTCRFAGYREGSLSEWNDGRQVSVGQLSFERQRLQMIDLLASSSENFFLMNDSDSVCLSAELPKYLYEQPDVLWANVVHDRIPHQRPAYGTEWPTAAFQPPFFMSRWTMGRLLDQTDGVTAHPLCPFIDFYVMQLATKARLVWKAFPDGMSAPICTEPPWFEWAQFNVRHKGTVFIHDIKERRFLDPLVAARRAFEDDYRGPGDHRPMTEPNSTAVIRPPGQEMAVGVIKRHNPAPALRTPPRPRIGRIRA